MSTFLFDTIIFGPVNSRRLGKSLGINLLPASRKVCNFNCIYCECGWTHNVRNADRHLPSREEIHDALDKKLSEMKSQNDSPDTITFAGNGEPTLHPAFPEIINDTIELRDKYFPDVKIAVLSNSSTIAIPGVREALLRVDMNILKLDSGFDLTVKVHNQPRINIKVTELIKNLKEFNGQLIIQTLFLRGLHNGRIIDNTTPDEVDAWLKAIETIKPAEVMVYTISRDTPGENSLHRIPASELESIAARVRKLGIVTRVSP